MLRQITDMPAGTIGFEAIGEIEDDGVVHPAAEVVDGSRAAEPDQRMRPDRHQQRPGKKNWQAPH